MTTKELLQIEQSYLARKSNINAVRDQINSYVLEAFRYGAIAKEGNEVEIAKPTSLRIYTSGSSFQTATSTGSFCAWSLCPMCTWSSEPHKYNWRLVKSESGKY